MTDGLLLGFQRMSKEPGVYLIVGTYDGEVLYVERSDWVVGRASHQHWLCVKHNHDNVLLQAAFDERDGAVEVYLKHTETGQQSRELERRLIDHYQPSCNTQGVRKEGNDD